MTQLEVKSQSPLAAIRQKESEVAQRLLAARQQATADIAQARQRAQEMIAQAESEGRQAGEAERQEMLAAIAEEAAVIVAQAKAEADRWQALAPATVETAVNQLITLVTGNEEEAAL